MIKLTRITDPDNGSFNELMSLYQESFPMEERRDIPDLRLLLESEDRMFFNAVENEDGLAGLLVYWKLDGFIYLEHLAVYPEKRNHHIGAQVLAWAAENLPGLRVLEAEPYSETGMAGRRIRYYERNGYKVCEKVYHQPSYREGGQGTDLWIMCSQEDGHLDEKLLALKKAVYGRE